MASLPTTSEAVRDRIIAVIESLTPSADSNVRFRAYRNEADASFEDWCETNPPAARRRFQVRDDGDDSPPAVTNGDIEPRESKFVILVAYPQTGRDGADQALDRDDTLWADREQIEHAVGMWGRANFSPPYPDACWLDDGTDDATRETGAAVDFLRIAQTMTFTTTISAAPLAAFTYDDDQLVVTFTDASSDGDGRVISWLWDFGDSSTSTEASPSHTYAAQGSYTVTLTVTDDDGLTDTDSQVLTAFEPTTLTAAMTASTDPVQHSASYSYALVVTNTGTPTATLVSAVTTVDSDATVIDASGTGWSCLIVGNVVTSTRASLATGAAPTITINCTAPATYQTASTTGSASAFNASVPASFSVQSEILQWGYDVTAGKHFPESDAEWTRFKSAKSLTVSNPSGIYLCQEASGNLADSGPTPVTLTANASPSYQQTVSGYDRKFVRVADASSGRFAAAAGVGPNPATTSSAWMGVYDVPAAPGSSRIFMGPAVNASANGVRLALTPAGQFAMGVVGVSVTATPVYASGVHFVGCKYDRTNAVATMYADLSATAGTYGAGAVDQNKGILTAPNSGSGAFGCGYGLRWDGAAAEANSDAEMAAMATAMGFRNTAPEPTITDRVGLGHASALLQYPTNYAATVTTARPLVVVLGGYGSPTGLSSQTANGWANLKEVTPNGALVLPLTGRIDAGGNHYWNADSTAADVYGAGGLDATYVRDCINQVIENGWNVDLTRVFVAGRSNGGFMAARMAASHSDIVTAIVNFGGSGLADAPTSGAHPVHTLIDHSVADPSVSYEAGGAGINGIPYISIPVYLTQVMTQNGSSGLALATANAYDHDSAVVGSETDRWTCAVNTGADTELWKEPTSGHLFAFTAGGSGVITTNWGADAWAWLMSRPRT